MRKKISFESHRKIGLELRQIRALCFSILRHIASGLPKNSIEYRVFMRMLRDSASLRNRLEERMFSDHSGDVDRMSHADKFSIYYGELTDGDKKGGSHGC